MSNRCMMSKEFNSSEKSIIKGFAIIISGLYEED